MSKVAIQGAATGTGVFTLASPATNTDRTLTLPDEAGTVLTRAAGSPDNSVVVDASGNVGIKTSSPRARLDLGAGTGDGVLSNTPSDYQIILEANSSTTGDIGRSIGWATGANTVSAAINSYDAGGGVTNGLVFATALSGTLAERARITSGGNLLVGTTTGGYRLNVTSNGSTTVNIRRDTNTGGLVDFNYGATGVGSISTNGTTTAYNTTSDYRLKEDIAPMTGALAKITALKPVTYKWKSTGEADEGFIAHELQEVCPSAVTGEKDAVDADGNPQYQGIDTSFLVATLTAAIQELKAINDAQAQTIESLTARVVALEGQP